jgi:hypothetical protein
MCPGISCLANIVLLTSASNKRIARLSADEYLPKVQQEARDNEGAVREPIQLATYQGATQTQLGGMGCCGRHRIASALLSTLL